MIVSRKLGEVYWYNLEGKLSRLSGSCLDKTYLVNYHCHRLYGGSYEQLWDINGKSFTEFKEVDL